MDKYDDLSQINKICRIIKLFYCRMKRSKYFYFLLKDFPKKLYPIKNWSLE